MSIPEAKRPRVRVALLIVESGRLLLVQHQKNGRQYWLLPGGGLDFGETARQAGQREVEEETGLQVQAQELLLASETIAPDGARHILHLVFKGELRGGELCCGHDPRLCDARFVDLEELKSLVVHPPLLPYLVPYLESGQLPKDPFLGNLWVE